MADVKTQVWYSTVLVPVTCCSCGIPFGLPENHKTTLVNNHKSFWCPNGHSQHFTGPSPVERERDEARRLAESLRIDANHQRAMRQIEERKNRALRGVVTRTKRRIAHGVCPCCQRTVRQLAAHMKTEHPDYVKAADAPEVNTTP
jgi:hypothetical protein